MCRCSTLRLRLFNGAGGTKVRVRFGGHPTNAPASFRAILVAVDSEWTQPLNLKVLDNQLWLAPGQRADVLVQLSEKRWQTLPIVAAEQGP